MNHSVSCLIELDIDLNFTAQVANKTKWLAGIYVKHLNDWVQLVYMTWSELVNTEGFEIWRLW